MFPSSNSRFSRRPRPADERRRAESTVRETPSVKDCNGEKRSLRWIPAHMLEETARQCGHADLIREAIDGEIGDFCGAE